MKEWREELRSIAVALALRVRRSANVLERLIEHDPYHIVGYRGYAGTSRVLVLGRVLQDEKLAQADPAHSQVRNLLSMLKRLESDPLPFARVRASWPGGAQELVADDEGFFRGWVGLETGSHAKWGSLRLELADPRQGIPFGIDAPFLVPPATAAYGVISDMDDTILQSHVTDFIRAAQTVLLENARTRLPFPGVAAFYRALEQGRSGAAGNPIFYVSSSPWNLYDLIAEFLEAQQIPTGPLLLRDWDLGPSLFRNAAYKTGVIREILATYPALPFILIGDSAQEDPEIYADMVSNHPGRILAVYIRNAGPAGLQQGRLHTENSEAVRELIERVAGAGSTLVLADDTLATARHAAAHRWIRDEVLDDISADKRADEGKGGKAEAPGVGELLPTPTIVVDQNVQATELE